METVAKKKPWRRRSFSPEFKSEIVEACNRGDRRSGLGQRQGTCALLEVSRAAYYEQRKHVPSRRSGDDAALIERITAIHAASRGPTGRRGSTPSCAGRACCGKKRVARLMVAAGLAGRGPKCWRRTTFADANAEARAVDLIKRVFGPDTKLDTRWCGDVTYIRTWEGWAYLATVIDLASRRVVGWALADRMRTDLVADALRMACTHRRPPAGVIFHSDRGCHGQGLHRLGRRARCHAVAGPQGRVLG